MGKGGQGGRDQDELAAFTAQVRAAVRDRAQVNVVCVEITECPKRL
jgi:hypothetical protein